MNLETAIAFIICVVCLIWILKYAKISIDNHKKFKNSLCDKCLTNYYVYNQEED